MDSKIDIELFLEVTSRLGHKLDYDEDGEQVFHGDWTDRLKFEQWLLDQNIPEPFHSFFLNYTPKQSLECNHGPIFGIADFIHSNDPSEDNYGHAEATRDLGLFRVGAGPNGDGIVIDVMGSGSCGWYPLAGDHEFIPTASTYGKFLKASVDHWDSVPKDWHAAKRASRGESGSDGKGPPAS